MPERRTVGTVLNKTIERVNNNMRRLRILEQESSIYKARLTSAEQEVIDQKNRIQSSIKDTNMKVKRMEERIVNMETTIKEIIGQFKKVTTTSKIKELEELIEIYNPLKSQFVTRQEVDKIIDERLKG